jgi:hypothetical protein
MAATTAVNRFIVNLAENAAGLDPSRVPARCDMLRQVRADFQATQAGFD